MRLGDFPLRHLLTPAQAARYLGVAPATLKTWRDMGIGPPCIVYEIDPGIVRYDVGAIDDWMASNTRVLCAPQGSTLRLRDRTVELPTAAPRRP